MSPELSAFLTANGTALVLVLGFVAVIGIVQWRKARAAEQEHEYKQALIEKGVPVADIEKAVAAKPPARRGLFEQFAALSGGAKAGLIVGFVVVTVVTVSTVAGAIHSHAFWSHVREQQANAGQRPADVVPPTVQPADTIAGNAYYLDLQPVANGRLDDKTSSLASLTQKRREFGGVPFQIGPGYLRLRGQQHPELPLEATGIRVGFAFDKLHALHATMFGAFGDATHRFHVADGTEVGRFRVRYTDKTETVIPIVYGKDVRDAWNWDKSRAVTRGKVVWTGTTPAATKEGVSLRLYLTTWDNPRPDAEVSHIDFIATGTTAASPFCVALTAERAVK